MPTIFISNLDVFVLVVYYVLLLLSVDFISMGFYFDT